MKTKNVSDVKTKNVGTATNASASELTIDEQIEQFAALIVDYLLTNELEQVNEENK